MTKRTTYSYIILFFIIRIVFIKTWNMNVLFKYNLYYSSKEIIPIFIILIFPGVKEICTGPRASLSPVRPIRRGKSPGDIQEILTDLGQDKSGARQGEADIQQAKG